MPMKRIVLCADGTWQSSNNGSRAIPSNVAKLSRAIECWDDNIPQIVYYDTGIGTNLSSSKNTNWLAKAQIETQATFEGSTGAGLAENVCEAYNFVVNNWSPGDELYIFGFSRGAYTARAAAGLLAEIGVCSNAMMDQFWEMYEAYKSKKPWQSIKDTAWGKSTEIDQQIFETSNGQYWLQKGKGSQWLAACHPVNIEVVGVFDTVGALGKADTILGNPYDNNQEFEFHNTDIHPQIKNAFHALAIDERRRPFTPTLWYKPEGSETNLIQCWFPGVHINVGGGSDDALQELTKQVGDLEGMANVTFAWMVDRIREFTKLKLNNDTLNIIVARYMDNMNQVYERQLKAEEADKASWRIFKSAAPITFRGWGVGPITDSYSGKMIVAGSRQRQPGRYLFRDTKYDNAPAAQKETCEYIHPVVAHAWSDPHPVKNMSYKAKDKTAFLGGALYGFQRKPRGDGKKGSTYSQAQNKDQGQWIDPAVAKKTTGAEWTSDNYPYWHGPVDIPEFQIRPNGKLPDGRDFSSMERRLITTSPLEEIADSWTGEDMLATLKKNNSNAYSTMAATMKAQNDRAKASLESWDKENGFA